MAVTLSLRLFFSSLHNSIKLCGGNKEVWHYASGWHC